MREADAHREDIWRGLLYGQRALMLRFTARLKRDFDLTAAQYEALGFLRRAEGHRLPASALAQRLLYSSGSASHLFSRLEARGLLRRTQDPSDARGVLLELSEAGLDLSIRAGRAHRADVLEHFAPLVREDEVQVLLRFSRRLLGGGEAPRGDGLPGGDESPGRNEAATES